MKIRREINSFHELADMVWSGATDTIADIQNANKEDEFMIFLEGVFCDEVPTDTEVNNFIWHDRDYIYENIGLTENGEWPWHDSIDSLIVSDDFDEFCGDCDCEKCICNEICRSLADCEALFEDYKNQVVTIDEIKEKVEEETGMNIWK